MEFQFVPMNLKYAEEMIKNWKYDGIYHIYDYKNEESDLLNQSIWGIEKFAALNENNDLAGELTIEFLRKKSNPDEEGCVIDYNIVKNNPIKNYDMWLGWGLKPELCGKGIGFKFVSDCINFSLEKYRYNGEYVKCAVAVFNERAIKVYKKIGFETFYIKMNGEIANEKYQFFHMQKKILNINCFDGNGW